MQLFTSMYIENINVEGCKVTICSWSTTSDKNVSIILLLFFYILYFIYHLCYLLIKTSQSGHSNSSQVIELSHNVQILLLRSRIISQYFVHL